MRHTNLMTLTSMWCFFFSQIPGKETRLPVVGNVIYEGRINGEFVRGDIDEKSLGLLMVGGHV